MPTPSTRNGSHAETKASLCVQALSKQYSNVWVFFVLFLFCFLFCFFFWGGGGACAEANENSVKKKLHKALRSVQFLASSGISFYFEILSYLACVEKTARLAFNNSVKLGKKSASDFSSL